jgi:VIT1/CCC1 family predicted Fe2+/Mn2+ transporter
MTHHEAHKTHRSSWLRATVMGANDGIVSTASLIIGVAAAEVTKDYVLISGLAGLVAGAMSMAAGEYVSVSSQADIEKADLEQEKVSLKENREFEKRELAEIYQQRGLTNDLSYEVAEQLMAHDALGAHARDEIGIVEETKARPIVAGLSSALAFTVGALLPLLSAWLFPLDVLIPFVALLSLIFLGLLGALAAKVGGAPILKAAMRVTFWGAMAMLATAIVGFLFGISV